MSHLSLENDRVSFVAGNHGEAKALFTIPLRSFFTLDDFISIPPHPVCLDYPLALFGDPPAIESSSTHIYLPHQIELSEDSRFFDVVDSISQFSSLWKRFSRHHPFSMRWESLDGRVLKSYEEESLTKSEAKELDETCMKMFDAMMICAPALTRRIDGITSY